MKNAWLRTIVAAVIAEALPIILLVLVIAAMSTGDATADSKLAPTLGVWIGPIGGAIATFLLAWWATHMIPSNKIMHGAIVGVMVAALDLGIFFASGAQFQPLLAFSAAGRIVAGTFGGMVANRRSG